MPVAPALQGLLKGCTVPPGGVHLALSGARTVGGGPGPAVRALHGQVFLQVQVPIHPVLTETSHSPLTPPSPTTASNNSESRIALSVAHHPAVCVPRVYSVGPHLR